MRNQCEVGSDWVERLGRRLANAPTIDEDLIAELLAAPVTLEDVIPWIRFDAERYVRVPVLVDERFEVRLLCWGPGQSSALHAHGDAACGFRVLSGAVTEIRLDAAEHLLGAGAISTLDGETVHQVVNRGETAAVTLHLYSPPLPVDVPSHPNGHRIVVVGGGFCGSALAVHLLRTGRPDLRITLVERGPHVGLGVAFGTRDPAHLLDVPADQMSLDPDEPDAFVSYARERGHDADRTSLLPRATYGAYVQHALAAAVRRYPGRLRIVRDAAVAIRGTADTGRRVVLGDGTELPADDVILAQGCGRNVIPDGIPDEMRFDPRLVRDPWAPGALRFDSDDRVLIVGRGLTAVDVLLTLRSQGHRGPVVAISRSGFWPGLPTATWRVIEAWTADGSLVALSAGIRDSRSEDAAIGVLLEHTDQGGALRRASFDRVVLCTGADTDVTRSDDPLVADRLAAGEIVADPLRLGVRTDADGRALGADGAAVADLWVLGTSRWISYPTRFTVADLTIQARDLATVLVERTSPALELPPDVHELWS